MVRAVLLLERLAAHAADRLEVGRAVFFLDGLAAFVAHLGVALAAELGLAGLAADAADLGEVALLVGLADGFAAFAAELDVALVPQLPLARFAAAPAGLLDGHAAVAVVVVHVLVVGHGFPPCGRFEPIIR
ncbi:hypothetical protein D3C78_1548520 [compost metagenome]